MLIFVSIEELSSFLKGVKHYLTAVLSIKARKEAEAIVEDTVLINGDYLGKSQGFTESKVLSTASGSDMNDSASFSVNDLVPENDLVSKVLLVKLGEAGFVFKSFKLCTLEAVKESYSVLACELLLEVAFRGYVVVILALNVKSYIGHLRVYSESNVSRESPRCSSPNEDIIVCVLYGKLEEYCLVLDLLVGACHLVLGERGSTTGAPGHRLVYLTYPAALVALLKECPDSCDIFVGVGVVGVIPVHPLTESYGLLGDNARELLNTLDTLVGELIKTVSLDVVLGLKAKLLLNLNLNPKTLRVKAVAVVGVAALHSVVLNEGVLKSSSPCMMDTHRVVGGDRAVNKAVLRAVCVFSLKLFEAIVFLPEADYLFFVFSKGILCVEFVLHIDSAFLYFDIIIHYNR